MRQALSVYWWAVKKTYEELFTVAGITLAWWGIGFVLPTIAVHYLNLPVVATVLLLVLVPPPTIGAHCYANELAHERSATFSTFWEGTKKYFAKSWIITLASLLIALIFVANVWFYGEMDGKWVIWVQAVFLSLLAYWSLTQMYLFPMYLELKEQKLVLAARNAIILVLTHPIYTLILAILTLLSAALSIVIVILAAFVGIVLIALIANRATSQLLVPYRQETSPTEVLTADPSEG